MANAQKPRPQRSPKQGICGTVLERTGNQMPTPGRKAPAAQPVSREVLVFPVLNMSQIVLNESGIISDLRGVKPVKTIQSDKQGKFCLYALPTGTYSLLVRQPTGLYANLFDIDGRIHPVTVPKGKVIMVTIEISEGAVF